MNSLFSIQFSLFVISVSDWKMLQQFLFLMLASNAVLSTYDECTSHVQRYSMLALYAQNKKLTEGFLLAIYAEVLAECVRACSQKANCKATNYKRATSKHESNCELLSSSPDSKEILQAVTGWTVYKHLTEDVSRQLALIYWCLFGPMVLGKSGMHMNVQNEDICFLKKVM